MNNYCYKFQHNFILPTKKQIYPNGTPILHCRLNESLLDAEIYEVLKTIDIRVRWIEVNYKIALPANITSSIYGTIHADGASFDNKAKINFVIGGTDSAMIWYEFIDQSQVHAYQAQTKLQTDSIRADSQKDKLKEVHRESFSAAIVNVGQLHSIENTKEERICIQLILEDMQTRERLDYFEAVERFQSIEHLINLDNSLSL